MLRIVQQANSAAAASYYSTADYYREGAEVAGVWGGRGASLLGLKGPIQEGDFDALCKNQRPDGKGQLTARQRADRTVGYDFNFSVPKSVSLVYGMCGDGAIRDAFQEAVRETMADIEPAARCRIRKKNSYADRTTSNLVWGEFIHSTSRPVDGIPDPHLHAHLFVFNATFDPAEREWKASQFRELKRDAPYWQAAFRARLANKLQGLGYQLEFGKDDFEVVGISEEVIDRFSRRTKEVDARAKKKGITSPRLKAELGAETRKAKNKDLPWDKLVEEWWSRLAPEEADALNAVARDRWVIEPESRERESVDHALAHCFERASVVSEKELLAEALRFGIGHVTVGGIARELGNRLLIKREVEGRVMVTTPEVLAEEQRIVAFARSGRGTCRPLVGFDRPILDGELNDQQQRAVRHLWQSPDRVLMLRGAAGVGKTRLLKEAVKGIEAAGQRFVALAQSADASRDTLRNEAGIATADTVARFLVDEKFQEQARHGVILIDEASLVGTRTMAKIVDRAKQLDARLILVGDEQQHGPIERGSAFRLLQQNAALPVVQVTEIQRQKGSYRTAVKALSAGRVLEGFDQLDRMGWVLELPNGEREKRMAADYVKITKKSGDTERSCLIVAPTNLEAAQITEAVRSSLRKAKRLGKDHEVTTWMPVHLTEAERADRRNYQAGDMLVFHKAAPGHRTGERLVIEEGTKLPLDHADRFQVFRPQETALARGDRIRLTANLKSTAGTRLNNGAIYSVRGFTPSGDVRLDNGHVVKRDFLAMQYGFVVTSYASQGKTVDVVLAGQSSDSVPATSKEQAYVAWSRGREAVWIYTDDKETLRDAIRHSDSRLLAHDLAPKHKPAKPRLKKHLEFLRRLATFARVHAPSGPTREQPALERGIER